MVSGKIKEIWWMEFQRKSIHKIFILGGGMGAGESFSMVIAEKFPSGSRVFFFFLYLFFVLNLQHRLFGCLENEKKKIKKKNLV